MFFKVFILNSIFSPFDLFIQWTNVSKLAKLLVPYNNFVINGVSESMLNLML